MYTPPFLHTRNHREHSWCGAFKILTYLFSMENTTVLKKSGFARGTPCRNSPRWVKSIALCKVHPKADSKFSLFRGNLKANQISSAKRSNSFVG